MPNIWMMQMYLRDANLRNHPPISRYKDERTSGDGVLKGWDGLLHGGDMVLSGDSVGLGRNVRMGMALRLATAFALGYNGF